MPKERIFNDAGVNTVPEDRIFYAELSWGREGSHVQLATLKEREDYAETGMGDSAAYVSLNRDEINKLIRALRKARDQVFGADA